MFGNYFRFLFSFSCFQGKGKKKNKKQKTKQNKTKKTNFFCFQNEKHVWLIERKNTFSKNKIQEICLVVVFEKVEFCFLWLIFFKNYIYSNSKTYLLQSI